MSSVELESLESLLTTSLSGGDLAEARRILYGRELKPLVISDDAKANAEAGNFEIAGYEIPAQEEDLRAKRCGKAGEQSE